MIGLTSFLRPRLRWSKKPFLTHSPRLKRSVAGRVVPPMLCLWMSCNASWRVIASGLRSGTASGVREGSQVASEPRVQRAQQRQVLLSQRPDQEQEQGCPYEIDKACQSERREIMRTQQQRWCSGQGQGQEQAQGVAEGIALWQESPEEAEQQGTADDLSQSIGDQGARRPPARDQHDPKDDEQEQADPLAKHYL